MPTREKRLERARNNPKDVRFNDLCHILRDHGFNIRHGKGDHFVATLPGTPKIMSLPRRNPMLRVYVERALELIDEIESERE